VRPATSPLADERIGEGEREAISLAAELGVLLLADDHAARLAASRRGVAVTGTVGVLERAAAQGLLSLPDALENLRGTTFRISDELIAAALQRERDRTS
jgi:predicted nucleic acid-binding protein